MTFVPDRRFDDMVCRCDECGVVVEPGTSEMFTEFDPTIGMDRVTGYRLEPCGHNATYTGRWAQP